MLFFPALDEVPKIAHDYRFWDGIIKLEIACW